MTGDLKLGRTCAEAVRVYFSRFPIFTIILLIPTLLVTSFFVAAGILVLGFSSAGEGMDPATLAVSITPKQWTLISGAFLGISVVLALAMAASAQAAVAQGRIGVREAYSRSTAKSMQIYWLQIVISAVALRFSPFAVPVLWFCLAFGSVVTVLEDLGPNEGIDRAWALTEGNRIKVLLLEVLSLAPLAAVVYCVAYLFLTPGPWFNLNSIPPYARLALSPAITAVLLMPIQFMFVAFARGYAMLKQAEQPTLHAKAASNVSSS